MLNQFVTPNLGINSIWFSFESNEIKNYHPWIITPPMFSLKKKIEELTESLLRPNRQKYSVSDLGPSLSKCSSGQISRHDLEIIGAKGTLLACSLFSPETSKNKSTCVVYLHSMAGSRLESLPAMRQTTERGFSFFAFDFPACGLSEGDIITFGIQECEEVRMVVQYLRKTNIAKDIVLWGRSMGAVTALLYASKFNDVQAVVADSAFSNMNQLVLEMSCKQSSLPEFILKIARSFVRSTLKETVGLDFDLLNVSDKVSNCKCPVLLIASKEDLLVSHEHSREIFRRLSGNKRILYIRGGHNETRPPSFFEKVSSYVQNMVSFGTVKIEQNASFDSESILKKEKLRIPNFESAKKNIETLNTSEFQLPTDRTCSNEENEFGEKSFISIASFSFAKKDCSKIVTGKIISKRFQNYDFKDKNNLENEFANLNSILIENLQSKLETEKKKINRRTLSFGQNQFSAFSENRISKLERK